MYVPDFTFINVRLIQQKFMVVTEKNLMTNIILYVYNAFFI